MSACVKCGNPGNGNIFQTRGGDFGSNPAARVSYCLGNSRCRVVPPSNGPEHLDCVCGACGYTWAERCKDAKL